MSNKTNEHAASVLKQIKAEVNPVLIKDYHMPILWNPDKEMVTGFSVLLTLSAKYYYTIELLEDWRKRFEADSCIISVEKMNLIVRFDIHYDETDKDL